MLDHVFAQGGEATAGAARRNVRPEDAVGPAEELLSRGLLVPGRDDLLVVPGEVGVALRGGCTTTEPVDRVPEVATADRPTRLTDGVGRGCGRGVLPAYRAAARVVEHPAGGGAPHRRARRARAQGGREHLHLSEPDAALVIETAASAGLLATRADADGNPVWVPTDAFDRWLDADLAARWVTLAQAWLPAPGSPGWSAAARPTTSPGTH